MIDGSAASSGLSVDGSTAADLETQLLEVPTDATNIVISIGGNDAILNSDLLALPVSSTTEALEMFLNGASRSSI